MALPAHPDGRLTAAHVVNDIVLAEEVLAAAVVGPHIARALARVVAAYGPSIIPHIDAAVELRSSTPLLSESDGGPMLSGSSAVTGPGVAAGQMHWPHATHRETRRRPPRGTA